MKGKTTGFSRMTMVTGYSLVREGKGREGKGREWKGRDPRLRQRVVVKEFGVVGDHESGSLLKGWRSGRPTATCPPGGKGKG